MNLNDIFVTDKRPTTKAAVDPVQRGRNAVLNALNESEAEFKAGKKVGKNYYPKKGEYFLKVAYGNMPIGGADAKVAVGGFDNLPNTIGEMRVHVENGDFDKEILRIADSYSKRSAA